MGAFGAGIARAGDLFAAIAVKRAEAEDLATLVDLQMGFDQTVAGFEKSRSDPANADESRWGEDWQAQYKEFEENASELVDRLSPDAKRVYKARLARKNGEQAIRTEKEATLRSFERAKEASQALVEGGIYDMDPEQIQEGMEMAKTWMMPGAYDQLEHRVELGVKERGREIDRENFESAVFHDSVSVHQVFESGEATRIFAHSTPGDLARMERNAKGAVDWQWSNATEKIRDGIYTGEMGEDSVQMAGEDAKMNKSEINSLKGEWKEFDAANRANAPMNWERLNALRDAVWAFDKDAGDKESKSKEWSELYARVGSEGAGGGIEGEELRDELLSILKDQNPLQEPEGIDAESQLNSLDFFTQSINSFEREGGLDFLGETDWEEINKEGWGKGSEEWRKGQAEKSYRAKLTFRAKLKGLFKEEWLKDPEAFQSSEEVATWINGYVGKMSGSSAASNRQRSDNPGDFKSVKKRVLFGN